MPDFDNMTVGAVVTWLVYASFLCSLLAALLPPTETFEKFPRFRDGYEVFIKILEHVALNRGKFLNMTTKVYGSSYQAPTGTTKSERTTEAIRKQGDDE